MSEDLSKSIIVKFVDTDMSEVIKDELRNTLKLKKLHSAKKMEHSKVELLELHEEDDLDTFIKVLHNHPGTHYAQLNHRLYPYAAEDYFSKQWGLCNQGIADVSGNIGIKGIDINISSAWNITKGCDNVLVAVLDTGTDIDHIDLKNNIAAFSDLTEDLEIKQWDFAKGDVEGFMSLTQAAHGTMTSGIIAGEGRVGISGVAPNIKLLPLKFMSAEHGYTSDAVEAIEYAEKCGVKIVNCSWGTPQDNPALLHHITNSSMLFVVAAGNDGNNIKDKPAYPASYDLPNLITVGAINNQGELAMFSNYGSQVHVAAPGVFIYTTVPSQSNDNYSISSGTSLAAPFVSGIAALILSVNSSLTADKIKSILMDNVNILDGLKGKIASGGIVDAYKALIAAKSDV